MNDRTVWALLKFLLCLFSGSGRTGWNETPILLYCSNQQNNAPADGRVPANQRPILDALVRQTKLQDSIRALVRLAQLFIPLPSRREIKELVIHVTLGCWKLLMVPIDKGFAP